MNPNVSADGNMNWRTNASMSVTSFMPIARLKTDPTFQAFWLMRLGFTLVPILFGADKFAHVMVNWDKYLAPDVQRWLSPFNTVHQTMYVIGAVEIFAGIVVLLLPRVGGYWDILMRDVALLLLALSFARLASAFPAGAIWNRVDDLRHQIQRG